MADKRRAGIQSKILAITLSYILGMCVIVSLLCYFLFANYTKRSLIQATETNLYLLSDSIGSNINDIYRISQFCQTNNSVASYLEKDVSTDNALAISAYNRINEEYYGNPSKSYITRLAVISDKNFIQIVDTSFSTNTNLAEAVPNLPYFSRLIDADGYDFGVGIVSDPFLRREHPVIPIIRTIDYKFHSKKAGYLYMEITPNIFTDHLKKYALHGDSMLVLNLGGNYYTYEDGQLIYSEEDIIGSKLSVTVPLNMKDCYLSQTISSEEIKTQRYFFLAIFLGSLLGILVIGLILIVTLNQMIHLPVKQLQKRMNKISHGDFNRDSSVEWNHELGDIGRGINDLAASVDELMKVRLEDEKQKRDLEYKMLQSQINPHFIYNTLNSIKWMATTQGATGISEITTALARLLKSISKGTKLLIPLSEELTLLEDYFIIQNYRYGGTITMNISVDDGSLYDINIVKFTLQPLVENAIFHGIEPKGGTGKIDVHVYKSGDGHDKVIIDVTDNGIGISEDKLKQLLTEKSDEKSEFFREIGISNVNKRLQYEFGEQYGISASSELDKYATMTITLPLQAANKE